MSDPRRRCWSTSTPACVCSAVTWRTPATEFIIWATHRRPWRERDVTVDGDANAAARVLDAIHVF